MTCIARDPLEIHFIFRLLPLTLWLLSSDNFAKTWPIYLFLMSWAPIKMSSYQYRKSHQYLVMVTIKKLPSSVLLPRIKWPRHGKDIVKFVFLNDNQCYFDSQFICSEGSIDSKSMFSYPQCQWMGVISKYDLLVEYAFLEMFVLDFFIQSNITYKMSGLYSESVFTNAYFFW